MHTGLSQYHIQYFSPVSLSDRLVSSKATEPESVGLLYSYWSYGQEPWSGEKSVDLDAEFPLD